MEEANLGATTSKSGFLSRLHDWLAVAQPCGPSDVIFVLAGREYRKHYALRLFRERLAPALLLSVGRFEIRRFAKLELPAALDLVAIASATEPRLRHYFVNIGAGTVTATGIAVHRFGTLNEILAFAGWLREHPSVRSVTIVSSGFHLRRIRICVRRFLPRDLQLRLVAVPDEGRFLREHLWGDGRTKALLVSEALKIMLYKLLCTQAIIHALRTLFWGRTATSSREAIYSR